MILRKHPWSVLLIYLFDAISLIVGFALSHYLCSHIARICDKSEENISKVLSWGIMVLFAAFCIAVIINAYQFLSTGDTDNNNITILSVSFLVILIGGYITRDYLFKIMPLLNKILPKFLRHDGFYFLCIAIGILAIYAYERIETDD